MDRRAILRGLLVAVPATAAAAVGVAAKSGTFVKETSVQSLAALSNRVDELKQRFDRSQESTKKTLRVLAVLTALSLGIDASALL